MTSAMPILATIAVIACITWGTFQSGVSIGMHDALKPQRKLIEQCEKELPRSINCEIAMTAKPEAQGE